MALNNDIKDLAAEQKHRFCTLWEITREDATVLRYTNHDVPFVYKDGNTYTPAGGFNTSAQQRTPNIQSHNLEAVGLIDSAAITEDDIRAGLYRNAMVLQRVTDWRYPWVGSFQTMRYWIDDITWDETKWVAQMSGITRFFRQTQGEVLNRTCRHDLGDSQCGVNLGSFTDTGEVLTVVNNRQFTTDLPTGGPRDDGWYKYGLLTWTTGANAGLTSEVSGSALTDSRIWLRAKTPYDIEAGDDFSVYAGCNKNRSTCVNKFTNIENFGGYPFLPGTDRLIKTPSAKFQ